MIVELKQNPDQSASAIGLDKHNRSKFPGTFEMLQPAKGIDGRWITGVDENSMSVNSITDPDVRAERKAEVKELRESIQQLLNIDISATNNEFWQSYKIILKDTVTLNLGNPEDKLRYYVLIANGYAAPELGAVNHPDYVNTKYYVSRKEEESKGRMVTRKAKDEARAKLLEISKDNDKLILIARFLLGSRRIKDTMNPDIIYEELSKFIDDPKDTQNVSLFTEATKKTVEELQYKLVIDDAIRSNIIRLREGYYQRGNATYGKSIKEVISHLSAVENAAEFASLKEEVESDLS